MGAEQARLRGHSREGVQGNHMELHVHVHNVCTVCAYRRVSGIVG